MVAGAGAGALLVDAYVAAAAATKNIEGQMTFNKSL